MQPRLPAVWAVSRIKPLLVSLVRDAPVVAKSPDQCRSDPRVANLPGDEVSYPDRSNRCYPGVTSSPPPHLDRLPSRSDRIPVSDPTAAAPFRLPDPASARATQDADLSEQASASGGNHLACFTPHGKVRPHHPTGYLAAPLTASVRGDRVTSSATISPLTRFRFGNLTFRGGNHSSLSKPGKTGLLQPVPRTPRSRCLSHPGIGLPFLSRAKIAVLEIMNQHCSRVSLDPSSTG